MEECKRSESDRETSDNRSAHWSRFGFSRTYNATATPVPPKPDDVDSELVSNNANEAVRSYTGCPKKNGTRIN